MTPVSEIDPSTAARLLDDGKVLLLDVREDDEWAAGHAPGATAAPLSRLDVTAVPRDRPVVAVCHLGGRSARAAQALSATGVDVRNLTGGMDAWERAGLPVVRDDGTPGEVI